MKTSEHHVEVSLADLHGYEKYVITTLLNEFIPSPNSACDHTNCRGNMQYFVNKARNFKQLHAQHWFGSIFTLCVQASVVYIRAVIVIHDADKLSSDLQHYIGWFLGRYAGCNKIIFCGSDASNLEGIKHLCKVVTLQPPSCDEVLHYTTCWSVLYLWIFFPLIALDCLLKDGLLLDNRGSGVHCNARDHWFASWSC